MKSGLMFAGFFLFGIIFVSFAISAQNECIDSDGGDNPSIIGNVFDIERNMSDYCMNIVQGVREYSQNGTSLREFFCKYGDESIIYYRNGTTLKVDGAVKYNFFKMRSIGATHFNGLSDREYSCQGGCFGGVCMGAEEIKPLTYSCQEKSSGEVGWISSEGNELRNVPGSQGSNASCAVLINTGGKNEEELDDNPRNIRSGENWYNKIENCEGNNCFYLTLIVQVPQK